VSKSQATIKKAISARVTPKLILECYIGCASCIGPEYNQCTFCSLPDKVLSKQSCEDSCDNRYFDKGQICYGNLGSD